LIAVYSESLNSNSPGGFFMVSKDRRELLRSFGRRLRGLRKEAGLSQERLAHLAGIDRTYIGGAERGERNVSIVNLARISNALGISLSELMKEVDS